MKNYTMTVTATYVGEAEVEANSPEEAMELIQKRMNQGEFVADVDFSQWSGVDYPEDLEDCPAHLESCDDDGYCNHCGEQSSDEEY